MRAKPSQCPVKIAQFTPITGYHNGVGILILRLVLHFFKCLCPVSIVVFSLLPLKSFPAFSDALPVSTEGNLAI